MGTLQGYVPKSFNSFRVYAFAMYQMCRVYFDGLLGDARKRTRYPWMELHYKLELEYKQCMWTQIMLYTKLPKTRVNTVGILKY